LSYDSGQSYVLLGASITVAALEGSVVVSGFSRLVVAGTTGTVPAGFTATPSALKAMPVIGSVVVVGATEIALLIKPREARESKIYDLMV
jgi:hypothetical protein